MLLNLGKIYSNSSSTKCALFKVYHIAMHTLVIFEECDVERNERETGCFIKILKCFFTGLSCWFLFYFCFCWYYWNDERLSSTLIIKNLCLIIFQCSFISSTLLTKALQHIWLITHDIFCSLLYYKFCCERIKCLITI